MMFVSFNVQGADVCSENHTAPQVMGWSVDATIPN